jgi:hypothetical protein
MKALAREPEERFQTADEMSAALTRAVPSGDAPRPATVEEHLLTPRRSFRSWIVVPAILLLLAGVAVGGFLLLEGFGPDDGGEGDAPDSPTRIRLERALAYDPLGGDGEHDESAPLATDGDDATFWTTEGYNQDLGIEKDGVGLVIQLREEAEVGRVRIVTDTPGWDFSIFVADDPGGLDHEGTPVRETGMAEGEGTYEIDPPLNTRYVLIWITGLVPNDGYRAHINEIDVLPPGD